MQNIIKDLYYGNINPSEKYIEKSSAYAKALTEATEAEEKLLALISGEELKYYEEFHNALTLVTDEELLESFTEGFRLGARFILDVLMNDKSAFHSVTE